MKNNKKNLNGTKDRQGRFQIPCKGFFPANFHIKAHPIESFLSCWEVMQRARDVSSTPISHLYIKYQNTKSYLSQTRFTQGIKSTGKTFIYLIKL